MAKSIKEFELIRVWARQRELYTFGDVKTQTVKLAEEFGEVSRAVIKSDKAELKDGLGDMLVVMINLAELADMRLEDCFEAAYVEIINRKGSMQGGSFVKEQ